MPGLNGKASVSTCSAVRAGTGNAPATFHGTTAGLAATVPAGAMSLSAHVP